jgi:hypothetical protein
VCAGAECRAQRRLRLCEHNAQALFARRDSPRTVENVCGSGGIRIINDDCIEALVAEPEYRFVGIPTLLDFQVQFAKGSSHQFGRGGILTKQ